MSLISPYDNPFKMFLRNRSTWLRMGIKAPNQDFYIFIVCPKGKK